MEPKIIISIILGIIVLLFLFSSANLFKWTGSLLKRAIIGVFLVYLINLIGSDYGLQIAINGYTAVITGILGIPGVIALAVINYWII